MRARTFSITTSLLIMNVLIACSLPGQGVESQDLVATWVAGTLTAVHTPAPGSSATPVPPAFPTSTLLLVSSDTPQPTSTPLNPLVLETILCWEGPGAQFEVVSALKKDERVEIIGRASIAGWWIVDNPIYHDPCWAQATSIQIEPGYNTATLPVYTPPPSPTPTPTNTRTPTNTPPPTNTP